MKNPVVRNFDDLLAAAVASPSKTVAVVNPNNSESFSAIIHAVKVMKTRFVLFGNAEILGDGTSSLPAESKDAVRTVACASQEEALSRAVNSVAGGDADILMKAGVDTSTMMKAVLAENSGLRVGRLLSDVFVFEYPSGPDSRFIMITDGGINLSPDLKTKVELINNALDVAHALGIADPRVAVLSASEFVNPNLQSTVDAAALSKMNERGQIKGGIIDGPLALDSALSAEAAEEKSIKSRVAGKADILLAPNIETANSLAKSTTYFAGLRLAHVVLGAKVPILIPSRADRSDAKLLSIALASVVMDYLQKR